MPILVVWGKDQLGAMAPDSLDHFVTTLVVIAHVAIGQTQVLPSGRTQDLGRGSGLKSTRLDGTTCAHFASRQIDERATVPLVGQLE
jgi:hypothetical protein